MGMFDYIRYGGHEYQTKDTPNQFLDQYEIREDGTLWHENYDSEWVEETNSVFGGYLDKKNTRWEFCSDFDGVIRFYRPIGKNQFNHEEWEEYKTLFMDGKMIKCLKLGKS